MPDPAKYTVYVGNVKRGAGTVAKVKSVKTRFDIAVLELDRDIVTTYAPLAETDPAVNSPADIFAWGGTCETGCGLSETMKTARMRVSRVDAGDDGSKMVNLAQSGDGFAWFGDSGGPAMLNGVQFGVLCRGDTSSDGSGEESYSSVANSLNWIQLVTGVGGTPPSTPSANLALNKAAKSANASCNASEGPAKAVNGTATVS
ncbi:MAG: peptidase [Actinomycetia bacterium]|nr:peptidase [Actinomycetes bacterium]